MQQTLRIGEAADQSGLATSAIRYYESLGLLPEPGRSTSGYREYDAEEVELLRFVARLRTLEFPLTDIQEIVGLRREGKAPCSAVRSTISREADAIESRIEDLKRLKRELKTLQALAEDLPDDWPTACVCNVLEPSTGSNS